MSDVSDIGIWHLTNLIDRFCYSIHDFDFVDENHKIRYLQGIDKKNLIFIVALEHFEGIP